MCIKCHRGISDEDMINSLEGIKDEDFIKWNTTSVSHLRLAALGMNGPKARSLAIPIFERFIEWRKTKPNDYMPESGLERMPSAENLSKDLAIIKNSPPDYCIKQSIIDNYEKSVTAIKASCSIQ